MGKLPAIQMYTGDWKKDPAVRSCSIAARGLWWEILQTMFDCPERGILKTGGTVWGVPEIAADAGIPTSLAETLLDELERKGVPSRREEDRALYCRRMVRDEEQRQKWKHQKREQRDVRDLSAQCPPGSSSSVSFSTSNQERTRAEPARDLSPPDYKAREQAQQIGLRLEKELGALKAARAGTNNNLPVKIRPEYLAKRGSGN